MMRQHDFEQLAVKPLGAMLDLSEIEPGFEIEVIGASAMLEIKIVLVTLLLKYQLKLVRGKTLLKHS